ncbi:MAG: hypothetical protein ABIM89_19465, partial [Mycobacteriales bacterium]
MSGRGSPPGAPAEFIGRLVEVDRVEWAHPEDVDLGDLEAFLAQHGIGLGTAPLGTAPLDSRAVVGAGLLLSGDIRTHRRSRRPAASPARRVPAACAVVYALGGNAESR